MQFSVLYVCNFSSSVDNFILFISSCSLKIQLSICIIIIIWDAITMCEVIKDMHAHC